MIYIFVGMAFSGIVGRLTLLAHRGGIFLEDNARKSDSVVILELLGLIVGIFAIIISFLTLEWYVPFIAVAAGYWLIAPMIVNRQTFYMLWQNKLFFTIGSIACSLMILVKYFSN